MKADPLAQILLLDLQVVDTRIAEIDRLIANPPQGARLTELHAQFAAQSEGMRGALGALEDTQAEIARAEEDIRVAQARRDQDRGRLDASSNPKEIHGLEAELDTLARRLDALEATQLELMQREEDESAVVAAARENRDVLRVEGEALRVEAAKAESVLSAERESISASRPGLVAKLPADLLAIYDKVRSRGFGVGAARLENRVCGSCAIQLGPADMAAIQKLTPADVAQCPQCDAILVRGAA